MSRIFKKGLIILILFLSLYIFINDNNRTYAFYANPSYTEEVPIYTYACSKDENSDVEIRIYNSLTNADKYHMIVAGTGEMMDFTSESITEVPWYDIRSSIYSLQFSSGITHIGSYVFMDCQFLLITLPTELEGIGAYAFLDCSRLRALDIPSTIQYVGYGAFKGCSNLYNLTLPYNMKNIMPSSGSLEELTPGVDLFTGCTNLTIVNYTGSINDWNDFTFFNSGISLQTPMETVSNLFILNEENKSAAILELEVTNDLGDIGDYQFYGVNNIMKLVIPLDYQCDIGKYAFAESGLTSVYVYDRDFIFNEGVISNSDKITLYGYKDSTAALYCENNLNINFVEINDIDIKIKNQIISDGSTISSTTNDIEVDGLIAGHIIEAVELINDGHMIKFNSFIVKDESGNDVTDRYININCTDGLCHTVNYINNNTIHYGECTFDGCDVKVDEEACYGGEATCDNPAICVVCGNEYEEAIGHDMLWHEEKSASCGESGVLGYNECLNCDKYFDQSGIELDDIIIPSLDHVLDDTTWNEEIPATCEDDGNIGHYQCSNCNKYFDNSLEEIENIKIDALGHFGGKATCEDSPICTTCGQSYGEASGHSLNWNEEILSTCESEGVIAHYNCLLCGKYFDENEIELLNTDLIIEMASHSLTKNEKVDAQCEQAGTLEHYHCSLCDKNYDINQNLIDDIEIPALEHVLDNTTWYDGNLPTCEDNGNLAHYECSSCNKYFNESKEKIDKIVIDALGHIGGTATCESKAICTRCNNSYGSPLGHTLNDSTWHDGSNATCESDGEVGHYECSGCNKYFNIQLVEIGTIIIKGGHILDETTWHDEVPPTCDTDGSQGHYECTGCNQYFNVDKTVIGDIVIESGHTLEEWIEEVAASCYQSGTKGHYSCGGCGKAFDKNMTELGDITIKPSHTLNDSTWNDEVPPTCDEDGTKGHYDCSGCDEIFDIDKIKIDSITIDMTGHEANHETYVDLVPATCERDGMLAHYYCASCNDYLTTDKIETTKEALIIPALGHTLDVTTWHNEVSPTCEEKGVVAHYQCTGCSEYFNVNKEKIDSISINELGHVLDNITWLDGNDATCEETGLLSHYQCSRCDKYYDAEKNQLENVILPALGHIGGSATCQSKAICDNCNSEYGNYDLNFHNFIDDIKHDDTHHYNECACGERNNLEEHEYSDWVVIKEATKEEEGLQEKECICGHKVSEVLSKQKGVSGKNVATISLASFSTLFSVLAVVAYIISRKKA